MRTGRRNGALLATVVTVALLMITSAGLATPLSHAAAAGAPTLSSAPSAPTASASGGLTQPVQLGGPSPSGPSVCPHPTNSPFRGQVVISATGGISPAGAPVKRTGNRLALTGPVNGSVLDLASNVTLDLSGCLLTYSPAPTTHYGNATAVEVRYASGVTVENAPIAANGSEVGVWVNHSASVTVYNASAESEETALGANESTDVNFTLDNALNASVVGIEFLHTVTGIALDDAANDSAVGFEANASQAITFQSDDASDSGIGVDLGSDSGTSVLSGTFTFATEAGAYLANSSNALLWGNSFAGNESYGVLVSSSTGAVNITGNTLNGGVETGVEVGSATGPVWIAQNDLENTTGAGVVLDQPGGPVTVSSNDLALNQSDESEYGVYVGSSYSSVNITGNLLAGGFAYGVYLDNEVYDDVAVTDNQIPNATADAIYSGAYLYSSFLVTGNNLTANATTSLLNPSGIDLDGDLYGSFVVSGNHLTGGFSTGVLIDSYVYNSVLVTENVITNVTEASLDLEEGIGGSLTVIGNDLAANASTSVDRPLGVDIDQYPVTGATYIADNNFTGGLDYGVAIYTADAFDYDGNPFPAGSVTLIGNNFSNITDDAVYIFYDGGDLTIRDNDFAATPFDSGYATGVLVDYEAWEYADWAPIQGSVTVTGNDFSGGLYSALAFWGPIAGSATIEDNDFENLTGGGMAVGLDGVFGALTVANNDFSANASTVGESVAISAYELDGSTTIANNTIAGGEATGVSIDTTTGPTSIIGNVISNVTDSAISIGTARAVTIDSNDLAANASSAGYDPSGIVISSAATSVSVVDNNLSGGIHVGVTVHSAGSVVVEGNDLSGASGAGIEVATSSVVTVSDNTLTGIAGTAISVDGADSLTVSDNALEGSFVAINATALNGPALISGNDASSTGTALYLSMGSPSLYFATVEGNNFSTSTSVAVHASSLNFVANNVLGTLFANLTGDSIYSFYANDLATSGGATVNLAGSTPVTGSLNAALPTGGNYWSGYTPSTVTNGIGSPSYSYDSSMDLYPLAQPWYPYAVTFIETGLPTGTLWGIHIPGVGNLTASAPADVEFFPSPGEFLSYSFTVLPEGELAIAPAAGSFTANGTWQTIAITFGTGYAVSFTESGLPSGTAWSVSLKGVNGATVAPNPVDFEAANGTYAYVAQAPAFSGYLTGHVTVSGAPVAVQATFNQSIEFIADGLPAGTYWFVNFTSTPPGAVVHDIATTAPSFTLTDLPLGVYTITWATANKTYYNPSGASQLFTSGYAPGGMTVAATFVEFPTAVQFVPSGLPSGTGWAVTVSSSGDWSNEAPNAVLVYLGNGSYAYSVDPVPGYSSDPSSGTLTVNGVAQNIPIAFTSDSPAAYPVTFRQSGVASSVSWTLEATLTSVQGVSSADVVGESWWFFDLSGPATTLRLANGTYAYTLTAEGYQTATGSFSVQGAATHVQATTEPAGSAPTAGWVGLLTWAVLASFLASVAVALALAFRARAPGRRPPGPSTGPRLEGE